MAIDRAAVKAALTQHPRLVAGAAAAIAMALGYGAFRLLRARITTSRTAPSTAATLLTANHGASGRAVELTQQEKLIERDFISKDKIDVDFRDIGGLEEQIREIEDLVLLPLSHAHLYRHSRVAQRPTGILLYGPPGTGKTLLAKAIARSARASFLTVNVATCA